MIDRELSPSDVAAIDAALLQPDIPLDLALLGAWVELESVPSYAERHARGLAFYRRLKCGETLHLQTPEGKRFSIRPETWDGLVLGYSVLEDGAVISGYDCKLIDAETTKEWLSELSEQ